jgi:hypothetical protein
MAIVTSTCAVNSSASTASSILLAPSHQHVLFSGYGPFPGVLARDDTDFSDQRRVIFTDGFVSSETVLNHAVERVSWTTADVPFPVSMLCRRVSHDFTFDASDEDATTVTWKARFESRTLLSGMVLDWLVTQVYTTYMTQVLHRLDAVASQDHTVEEELFLDSDFEPAVQEVVA